MPLNILINGGGIAGPCLAFWLTRQGHAVTITEQAGQLRTGGQAVDFRGPSLAVLDTMGLLNEVRASATLMGPLILVDERGKKVGRLPSEVISGEVEIFWGDLARILYDASARTPNTASAFALPPSTMPESGSTSPSATPRQAAMTS